MHPGDGHHLLGDIGPAVQRGLLLAVHREVHAQGAMRFTVPVLVIVAGAGGFDVASMPRFAVRVTTCAEAGIR